MRLDPYVLIGVVLAWLGSVALGYHYGGVHTRNAIEAKTNAAALKATQEARATEQAWVTATKEVQDAHDQEIRRVSAARDDALRRLRDRPSRADVPEAAASAPSCGTGAALYREDAEVVIRIAGDADELRAALQRCQDWAQAVTR